MDKIFNKLVRDNIPSIIKQNGDAAIKIFYIILICTLLCLTGCKMKYPEFESEKIAFKTNNYIESDDWYLSFEYNNRTYLPYGTLKGTLKEKDLAKCIGYIVQDENSSSIIDENNKDTRVYTLAEAKDNNFLMVYYIKTNLMNEPIFYRAIDTKEKDITIPKIINSLDYNYWK